MATQRDTKGHDKINAQQKKINDGQRDINGALCYVDWHVIKCISALMKALEDAGVLTDAQLDKARKELKLAYYTSERVADINPPGCGSNFEVLKEDDIPDIKAA
jgi:hypothetical protein